MTADLWNLVLVLAFTFAAVRVLDLWLLAVQSQGVQFVEPEVKTYPEGCTCIRGAMLDNPRCPHHGGEHEWTA